ncbi:myo-inosose-2 dehydratase [Phenylobacterium sp.]|uniref:myo-inosose-2 dehydratase n=1 Tax=Phenylobacterium sp. TaxID=1871053 RepID=UPI002FC696BD
MTIRFGVSPIAWVNDDMPELGGDTPLETILSDARDIGFAGVELGGKFPRDPAVLKPLMAGYGLDIVGGWFSGNLLTHSVDAEIAAAKDHLALLKAMGSTVFVHAETSNAIHGDKTKPLTATPQLDDGQWKTFARRLSDLADYVTAQGLKFAYHHHLGTVVERPADLKTFLLRTGTNVGLTLDTGHAALGGIDAADVIRTHPRRVAHVHCKDVRSDVFRKVRAEGRSFLDGVLAGMFTVPGDGDLDYGRIMQALAAVGYSGWIIIEAEQDPEIADPRIYGELGLRTLEREAAAAGLKKAA